PILWQALKDNTLQAVSTDHCPFWYEGGVSGRLPGKELGKPSFDKIPNGMPGIEDRMPVMWHHGVNGGHYSANRFVEITATNPAKIFGMYPRKGTIAVGSDADIVIFDPDRKETISIDNPHTHHMRVDYSTYEGFEVQGFTETVLSRGRVIIEKNALVTQGGGQFIKRAHPGEPLR
ncbi:MAG: amidohydrolase family protein, partial [Myxococcales bacterium]|nr:amidohydrolase family protein [Myxococcales bacterium]